MAKLYGAFIVFGRNLLDGTVSSTILFVIFIELALLIVDLVALLIVLFVKHVGAGRQEKDYYVAATAAPVEVTLKEIVLDTSAVRRHFVQGDEFDCSGLIVTALYSDGSESEVEDYSLEKPTLEEVGDFFVTVRYEDAVAEYPITVEERVVELYERTLLSIGTDVADVPTRFKAGEPFSSEGLKVIAHYSAEPTEEYVTDFTVDAPDMSVAGPADVAVHYGGMTCEYAIEIEKERTLVGISLDTTYVKRVYEAGELFSPVGLIVNAEYDAEPLSERVFDFEIIAPEDSTEGIKTVTVNYEGMSASYDVTFAAVERAPLPFEEETGAIRYDRSFTARLIQSDDDVKQWYSEIKNHLLSYKKVKDRMSWKRETYKQSGDKIAIMSFRGKMLCLFLKLDPAEYADSKYKVEDASDNSSTAETPLLYRIKNDKRAKYALQLIDAMMEKLGIPAIEREQQDYYLPYEGVVELIEKGLIRRNIATASGEIAFKPEEPAPVEEAAPAPAEEIAAPTFVLEEESVEAGVLRYDRSFTARLIQSDDEVKQWYGEIKNRLLSYKKVKDRMSWKRETYKFGGGKVALLGFRGKVLCLFLKLDPAEYADSKYKIEDASDNSSTAETPLLYRIKNDKRAKYALQLIDAMMESLGAVAFEREPVDYYMPNEGILELIKKGLIRRDIKSTSEEALFRGGQSEETAPAEEAAPVGETAPVDEAAATEDDSDPFSDVTREGGEVLEWSFAARLANAYDDVKEHYAKLKNELLSFAGTTAEKARFVEAFTSGGACVARLAFVDGVLTVFLALDPNVYDGAGYLVADAAGRYGCADTPLMFAIRSDRDVKLADDLISDLAGKAGLAKYPRAEENYREPYRTKEELIASGQIVVRKA